MAQPSPEPSAPLPSGRRPDSQDALERALRVESAQDIEALGRVAAVVGHELTNVLQILANSVDRLADPAASGSPIVRMARASLDRGVRLARQLQAFAQTNPPRVQRIEAHQALATWLPTFEDVVGRERIIELRLRHGAAILVDPVQLQTALANVLANARDATPPGSVIVIDLARVERAAGPSCRVAVMDRGEGMSDEIVRQAVEPFFTTRAPGHGLGLGLTIARMVAESHGGYLEVESRLGLGTTVSLLLPVANGDLLTALPPPLGANPQGIHPLGRHGQGNPHSGNPHSGNPGPSSPGRVLVVDDEEAIAEYFRIILAAERYEVTVVASMRRAIEEFGRDPGRLDAVLLDMMLGDGTGLELYRRIRQVRPDLPIVVCTGFADNDALEQIRGDGHEVLLKPCTRAEVVTAIGRAVARGRRR
jgi:CheY-like chemotaxis protein